MTKQKWRDEHLNDTFMKVQMMNLVSAHQNNVMMTLPRLLFQGVTENQILHACRFIEMNGHNPIWRARIGPDTVVGRVFTYEKNSRRLRSLTKNLE
jgi:hypothetical protein